MLLFWSFFKINSLFGQSGFTSLNRPAIYGPFVRSVSRIRIMRTDRQTCNTQIVFQRASLHYKAINVWLLLRIEIKHVASNTIQNILLIFDHAWILGRNQRRPQIFDLSGLIWFLGCHIRKGQQRVFVIFLCSLIQGKSSCIGFLHTPDLLFGNGLWKFDNLLGRQIGFACVICPRNPILKALSRVLKIKRPFWVVVVKIRVVLLWIAGVVQDERWLPLA